MPELHNEMSERVLLVGDVLMVSRKMRDKATNKAFLWKFFMVLAEPDEPFGDRLEGYVLGATNEKLREKPMPLYIGDEKNTIHYLPMEEWPDGVHAFRMALIMQRKIDVE